MNVVKKEVEEVGGEEQRSGHGGGEENEQPSTLDYAFTTKFIILLSLEISVSIQTGSLYACAHKDATSD